MVDKKESKEKTRKIYEVLPKLDDQRCGYKSCGEFARAVAEGKAPCYGCVSGGPEVATKVCGIMGAKVPQEAIPRFGLGGGMGLGVGRGRGMGQGRGMGRGGGRGGGFGRGRHGR
jgi:hypothetical protein